MPAVWKAGAGAFLGGVLLAGLVLWPLAAPLALLLDVANRPGVVRSLLPVRLPEVTARDIAIPTRFGDIRARVHDTRPASTPTVVVIPGVHGAGLDEPRLAATSARLAQTGLTVITAPLPDLREYRITGRATDQIEDVALWVADRPELAPTGKVGLLGVSFAGGLAVVAAGRPSLRDRVDVVVTLGGHGDMRRALTYLSTGVLPDGTTRPPHDYSVAIFALTAANMVVPSDQVASLERGIRTYLEASLDESLSQQHARTLLADARQQAVQLAEPARTMLTLVNDRNVEALGRRLAPTIDAVASDPSLSPERSPAPPMPVYLLHGTDDTVIPSTETAALADFLVRSGHARVRALVTPGISHVGVRPSLSVGEGWKLLTFWRALLDELRR